MTKIIIWEATEGPIAGETITTVPAPQADLAQTRPEVAEMTESEYLQFIIAKDITPHNPANLRVIDAEQYG